MKKVLSIILFLFLVQGLYAQEAKDIKLGTRFSNSGAKPGGLYDYSDPESFNMKVSVWGFVKFPGRYNVPISTTVSDLLSYAGGPTDASNLEDLRLYRVMQDSTQHLFKFDFNDLLWSDKLENKSRKIPKLQGSDLLVVPGEPRLYFKNWFRLGLSIFSAIGTLIFAIILLRK
ncbi:MAG: SLBB domain-containing protein [Melioribacteraceae bacterium]